MLAGLRSRWIRPFPWAYGDAREDAAGEVVRLLRAVRRPSAQQRVQRAAVDVLHHQAGMVVDLDDIADRHDVRVLELRLDLALAEESLVDVPALPSLRTFSAWMVPSWLC